MTQELPKRNDAPLGPMDKVEPKALPIVYMACSSEAFKSEQEKADWIKSIRNMAPYFSSLALDRPRPRSVESRASYRRF
jgi:hypothetical protein